jgi:cytochrome P450
MPQTTRTWGSNGTPGTLARWSTRHGIARAMVNIGRRRGDGQAILFTDPAIRANPYQHYDDLRERGKIVTGMLMLLTAHHDVASAVLRSDRMGVGIGEGPLPGVLEVLRRYGERGRPIGPIDPPSMLTVNAPDHTRYRRLVVKVFTARAMEAMRSQIEERCAKLLDDLDGGETDIVARYAALLPVTVIAEILAIPVSMREQFLVWGQMAAPTLDLGLGYREFRRTERAIREMNAWMHGHFQRLRRDPGDDLLSQLVHVDEDGQQLTDRELLSTAGLLLAAGFETTVNLLGSGIVLLRQHPEQLATLRAEPDLWRNAVEEILRYESPVQNTGRVALADSEFGGRTVRRGQVVATLLGAANRDPAVFDNPHQFDVRRRNAREHLAFSSGAHYCLGASLARLEGEIGLRALFDRYPDLTLAGEPRRRPTRTLRGYESIPVRLDARRRTTVA